MKRGYGVAGLNTDNAQPMRSWPYLFQIGLLPPVKRRVARCARSRGAAEQAGGDRAAGVGRVGVVGLDVVVAAAGRDEVRVGVADG